LAASAILPLVQARGHRVDKVPSIPLVVDDDFHNVENTSGVVGMLKRFGAYQDVQRCIKSKTIRAGRGKARNRRYSQKIGPLIIVNDNNVKL